MVSMKRSGCLEGPYIFTELDRLLESRRIAIGGADTEAHLLDSIAQRSFQHTYRRPSSETGDVNMMLADVPPPGRSSNDSVAP